MRLVLAGTQRLAAAVFDVQQCQVSTLLENGAPVAGEHPLVWDTRSDVGHRVTPGIYVVGTRGGAKCGHRGWR